MKTRLAELALFGGNPAFQETLHVGRPNLPDRGRLLERIGELLDRRWLTNDGPFLRQFEQRVCDLLGVRHCVATCNGTMALQLAIKALGLAGEVVVPAFTFVATPHALQWHGITPVFCDIDPHTCNLDPGQAARALTERTSGIIGVHLWGRPCDVEALTRLAERRKLRLLFDAAQAFGCSYRGRMLGHFGDAELFSFHATKFLNTFEGGAVATNDDTLAAKVRLMRNFGFAGYDRVTHLGTNAKMSEVAAAMGLTGLESLEQFYAANRRNYNTYERELRGLPGVRLLRFDERERCNYHYVILEVDEAVTRVSRDQLVEILHAENVLARRYFYPGCHRLEPYRSSSPRAPLALPQTEWLAQRVLALPTGTAVGERELGRVCQLLRLVLENGPEVRRRMEAARARTEGGHDV